jgi:hypothetical protein
MINQNRAGAAAGAPGQLGAKKLGGFAGVQMLNANTGVSSGCLKIKNTAIT